MSRPLLLGLLLACAGFLAMPSATAQEGAPSPDCPTGLTAELLDDGAVRLEWTNPPDSNGSRIGRAVTNTWDLRHINWTETGTTAFVDNGTYAGTTFHYSLEPVWQPLPPNCPMVSVDVPGERTYFPCPVHLELLTFPDGVYVTWHPAEGSQRNHLYRSTGDGPFVQIDTSEGWDDYWDTNVTIGTAYTYQIRAFFEEHDVESPDCPTESLAAGWRPTSTSPGSSPPAPPPPPEWESADVPCPSDLALDRQADGTIVLTWVPAADSNATNIYRSTAGGSFVYLGSPAFSTFHDLNATEDVTYTYTARGAFGNVESRACPLVSTAAVPSFPTFAAAFLAVAGAAMAYGWVSRRRSP